MNLQANKLAELIFIKNVLLLVDVLLIPGGDLYQPICCFQTAHFHFNSITTISGEFPVLIGGPQVPTPLVV